MGDVGGGEEGHLLFGGAHEEEAGGVEELWILEMLAFHNFKEG